MNRKIIIKLLFTTTLIMPVSFVVLFFFAPHAHAAGLTVDAVYQVLGDTTSGSGKIVADIWRNMINLVDSLVILALIAVAFANILRYQLDSYAVKKFLPAFIMAVILANFSFLISRIVIDIANMVMSLFLFGDTANNITGAFNGLIGDIPDGPDGFQGNYVGYILGYIFKQSLTVVGAVLVFILAFIFLIRNYLIYFLVAIAPLGFMAMVLPVTKKYFQMWWSNFTKWVFMPVVSLFWLWLAGQFMSEFANGSWLLVVAFAGLCFYMAITTPFKVGGAVMGAWAGWGKKAWSGAGRQVGGIGARTTEFGQSLSGKYAEGTWQNKWGKRLEKTGGVINFPASIKAYKRGRQLRYEEFDKAAAKTGTYEKFGGRYVRAESAFAKHEDEFKYASPEIVATKWVPFEDSVHKLQQNRNSREGMLAFEELNKLAGGDSRNNKFDNLDEAEQRKLERLFGQTYNPVKLRARYPSLAKNEEKAVELVNWARQASQDLKGARSFDEFKKGYDQVPGERAELPDPWANYRGRNRPEVPPVSSSAVPTGTVQAVIPQMQELIDAFHELENKIGGAGSLGGEEGISKIAAELSKMKVDITPESLGVAFAKISGIKVDLDKIEPAALDRLMNATRRVQRETGTMGLKIEEGNATTLRNIAQVMQNAKTPEEGARNAEVIVNLAGMGKNSLTGETPTNRPPAPGNF